ncbi:hypothetical protein QVD17_13774 [Tagetes erecta]|uniref:Uncharacterized protein n=1 Tax=Tagetes erecta TaxID=13708 RepID=A0AAD8L118_TARER|nr:hypothetical protein QVD17_13774 [Tagetes erecta]
MISAISWIPKGASKSVPSVADPLSKDEIEEMKKLVILQNSEENDEEMSVDASKQPTAEIDQALGAANALGNKAGGSNFPDIADGLEELNMDDYDNEDDEINIFGSGLGDTYYPTNELDPYLKDANDDDSEEVEDMFIKSDDAVVVLFKQVYIIEDPDGDLNMFGHHHIDINAFPLCTAWLDCPIKGGEKGNFMAVGTMDPGIEIRDLDIIDEAEPALMLGGFAEKKNKKKKGKKVKNVIKYKEDSHTGPVLALAWNKGYRNILASGSADKTVKRDVRVPTHSGFKWSVSADVESLAWDPHDQHLFVASLENGTVVGFDIRTATSNSSTDLKPKFTLHAHDKAVCAISYNPLVPNLLATGSEDHVVKLWDLSNNQPSCIASQNPKAGAVFSVSFSGDCPFLLAIAGSEGKLKLWDTLSDSGISKRYEKYAKRNKGAF